LYFEFESEISNYFFLILRGITVGVAVSSGTYLENYQIELAHSAIFDFQICTGGQKHAE
jgi:hypothetical protein